MHQSDESVTAISQKLGLHRTTVSRWIKRYEQEGDVSTRPKNGRSRVTTVAEDQELVHTSRRNPQKTSIALQRELLPNISISTVRSRLRANGLKHRIPASKEELTESNVNDRLTFVQMYE